MSAPNVPLSIEQTAAFQQALCDYLGLDMEKVAGKVQWEMQGDYLGAEVMLRFRVNSEELAEILDKVGIPD